MTRGDLIRHCSLEMGLDTTAAGAELLLMQDWANEAVVDVLMSTRCHLDTGDQVLTPGVGDYAGDANILAVDERTIQANTFPIQLVSIADIFEARRGSASSDYVMKLAFEGDLFMVWPTPSTAVTIRYVYVPKPALMTADANDPSTATYGGVPTWAHPALRAYMLWQAARYDEKKSPHTPNDYYAFYQTELQKVRRRSARIAQRQPLGMSAGYPDRPSAGRFNDIYPAN